MLDPAFFDAAVLNLVTNARDAMPNGGRIEISTRQVSYPGKSGAKSASSYVLVKVKDEGFGMSSEVLRDAFDPLFTTKGDRGTGLGLPQVRAFTEMVGGTVSICSAPGEGTTVSLLFPAVV